MKYSVQQAERNLSRLLREACAGQEVIIVRGDQNIVKLVALPPASKKRLPGRLAGVIFATPDAFDPLSDSELSALGFE